MWLVVLIILVFLCYCAIVAKEKYDECRAPALKTSRAGTTTAETTSLNQPAPTPPTPMAVSPEQVRVASMAPPKLFVPFPPYHDCDPKPAVAN